MLSKLIILIIILLSGVLLSVWHCYLKRGPRLTFIFFFFSFLYILRWVLKNMVSPSPLLKTAKQLTLDSLFKNSDLAYNSMNTFLVGFVILLEWILLFYIGWFVAEKIMHRFNSFQKRLFPTLLLSSLVTVSFLYPIEAIGRNLGWWRWQSFIQVSFDVFFIDCPAHTLKSGFYFILYFLATYLLIECSKFRHKSWKMIFFVLPFVHLWTIRFFGNGLPRVIERMGVFAIIIALTFLSTLEIEGQKLSNDFKFKNAERMFSLLVVFILAVLSFIIMFIVNKPALVFTLLPALFFYLFSVKNILPGLIFVFCVLVFFAGRVVAIPSLIPVFVFLVFKLCDHSEGELKKWI